MVLMSERRDPHTGKATTAAYGTLLAAPRDRAGGPVERGWARRLIGRVDCYWQQRVGGVRRLLGPEAPERPAWRWLRKLDLVIPVVGFVTLLDLLIAGVI